MTDSPNPADQAPEPAAAPAPVVQKTKTSSLTLPGLGGTGKLGGTGALGRPAPGEPAIDPAEASKERMAYINSYLKAPKNDPAFQDRALIHRLMSEEREYQVKQELRLNEAIRGVPPDDPDFAELESRLKTAKARQSNLATLIERLPPRTGPLDPSLAPEA
jgi:hypothetical protein